MDNYTLTKRLWIKANIEDKDFYIKESEDIKTRYEDLIDTLFVECEKGYSIPYLIILLDDYIKDNQTSIDDLENMLATDLLYSMYEYCE